LLDIALCRSLARFGARPSRSKKLQLEGLKDGLLVRRRATAFGGNRLSEKLTVIFVSNVSAPSTFRCYKLPRGSRRSDMGWDRG
jgi:hypothetical protein